MNLNSRDEQISNLQQQNANISADLSLKNKDYTLLRTKLDEEVAAGTALTADYNHLRDTLVLREASIDSLSAEVAALTEKLKVQVTELAAKDDALQVLQGRLDEALTALNLKDAALVAANAERSTLSGKQIEINTALSDAGRELTIALERLSAQEQRAEELTRVLDSERSTAEELVCAMMELQESFDAVKAELGREVESKGWVTIELLIFLYFFH
jgi:chromosome segregation ATPase